MKKVLMFLGTVALMVFHGYLILVDGSFKLPIAGQFVLLHFIWFDLWERQIEKAIASIR